jgi:hypothetical protein
MRSASARRDAALDGDDLDDLDTFDSLDEGESFALALRALAAAPPIPLEALAAPLPPGTCLDEFELKAVIGRGGMSVVYRARDLLLDREVAVKVLNPSWAGADIEPDALLEREARATARLRHPRIVTIHRVGRHDGCLYLVLELLEGETLAARLGQGPISEEEAAEIALELLAALAHAHAHRIVHRDVKPGNVFIESSGSVKVLDFGLSGLASASLDGVSMSRNEPVAGTPGYMAPELWRGRPADARTDVYAAGVVLRELIAASSPARARATARGQIEAIAARATAGDRKRRFADAGEMAAALRAVVSAAGRRRAPWRRAAGALAVVTLAAAVAIGAVELDGEQPIPDLSGTWQAEPAGFGTAVLQRIGPGIYSWEQRKSAVRVDDQTFYNRGTLELRRDGDRLILAGELADVPGWCCGNVGLVELELTRPDELRIRRSLWGKRHGEYRTAHAAYWFIRQPR